MVFIKAAIYRIGIWLIWITGTYKLWPKTPGLKIMQQGVSPQSANVCVFAHYSSDCSVAEYVYYHLEALRLCHFDIVFVSTATSLNDEELSRLREYCFKVVIRNNIGYDFGSWKCGLLYCGVDLQKYENLLLTNDSIYSPIYPLKEIIASMNNDMNGITDSYEIGYHLMSYFVLYKRSIFLSQEFLNAWREVRMLPNFLKGLIIRLYEVGMSKRMKRAGFKLGAFISAKTISLKYADSKPISNLNVVHAHWKDLILREKCPVMKVDLFRRFIRKGNFPDWQHAFQNSKYPVQLILDHQGIK